MESKKLEVGKVYELNEIVGQKDLASSVGSGLMDVLATPVLIAWMEKASVKCLDAENDEMCSLGIKIDIEHVAPTPLGSMVKVISRLTEVDGKRFSFEVSAYDEFERIGFGKHVRAVVKSDRFLEKVAKKSANRKVISE